MEFLWFILIGLIAEWLAGVFMRGGGFGIVGDIIVGVIVAIIGGFCLAPWAFFPPGHFTEELAGAESNQHDFMPRRHGSKLYLPGVDDIHLTPHALFLKDDL